MERNPVFSGLTVCPYYLKRFPEFLLCGLRGVAMTGNRTDLTDRRTDGRTEGQKHYTLRNPLRGV